VAFIEIAIENYLFKTGQAVQYETEFQA